MGKETPQVTNEGQLTDSNRPDVKLFPKSDIVFSRGILPKVFEIASSILFTASSSGGKRYSEYRANFRKKYIASKSAYDDILDRLTHASIEHGFSMKEVKGLDRNDLIVWLRQHGMMQKEVAKIFGITYGRVSQIEKNKGESRGVLRTSTDRMMEEMDGIGQERIDELISTIAENKEFWDIKNRRLKTRRVLKELGLPYKNSNLNARRIRYLKEKYNFPTKKAELLFRAKYPHLRYFRQWLTKLYVEQSIPAEKIAELISASPHTIASELVRAGIKIKPKRYRIEKNRNLKPKNPSRNVPDASIGKRVENTVKLKDSPDQEDETSSEKEPKKISTARLRRAIRLLPDVEKEVIIEFMIKGFTIEDISYHLAKDKKSVKRILDRAQSHLKKILESK